MPGTIYKDNANNVWVKDFKWDDGSGPINDANLILSVGDMLVSGFITALTNANPIVATSNGHGLANGRQIVIVDVAGNLAANGPQTVAGVATNTFQLSGVAGTGALLLPSAAANYPRWFATLPGLWGMEFQFVSSGKYKSVIPSTADILPEQDYWIVATALNYGYQVQTGTKGKVRKLGSLL